MKFGTDGIRGAANTELTADLALRLGRAAARALAVDRVVVGGDTRQSTPMLDAALCAGFASAGVQVERLGVVPTPAVAHAAGERGAAGAMVSASHNPYGDNGIKLFAPGGAKLTDEQQATIESLLADEPPLGDHVAVGSIRETDVGPGYVSYLVDVLEGRKLDGLTVVLDAANGAAFELGPSVLSAAGALVIPISTEPDGTNINAGCGATDTAALASAVADSGADLGLALDGDADRLIAVDHAGRSVDGDHIMAICAADLRDRGRLRDDTVVVTVMTNLGFRHAMRAAGIQVIDTAVGDRYVLEELDRRSLTLGGEQSGHIIFPEVASTGDGLLTGLVLADVIVRSGRPLAELATAAMTVLPQVLVNVRVEARSSDVAAELASEIAAAERALGEDGRVLVRASGTEPLVRIMVEAATEDRAHEVADRLTDATRERFAPAADA